MPSYKFKYFNARGYGEVSRILFALADQQYEDVRFTQETWPAEKPNVKLGQLPVLEIDGKTYGQSSAISRYLARTFGFYGKTDIEALEVDQVLGISQDMIACMVKAHYEKDEARKAEFWKENMEEKLPRYFKMLQTILEDNGNTGYYVGDKISLADVTMFDLCEKVEKLINFDDYPAVKKSRDMVGSNNKVKVWIEKRPVTEN